MGPSFLTMDDISCRDIYALAQRLSSDGSLKLLRDRPTWNREIELLRRPGEGVSRVAKLLGRHDRGGMGPHWQRSRDLEALQPASIAANRVHSGAWEPAALPKPAPRATHLSGARARSCG